ncbi:MAG: TIGR02757 family protein [Ignavibacteria bacterium]|jgi:uncharacterized protein (TIGR02757 family)
MNLKQKLDYHYKAFDRSSIEPDPLQFLYKFTNENDIEAMGLIASIFAYGNVKQIINTLNNFLKLANGNPHKFLSNYNYNVKNYLSHRFYTKQDVSDLFTSLRNTFKQFDSIKELFYKCYELNNTDVKGSISCFSHHFLNEIKVRRGYLSRGIKFMFPLPEKGSACKRMNLLLRWMVRKDELDFGIWSKVPTSDLIIPVDTHVARISIHLGLTSRKNPDWKMAEEITGNLIKFDSDDPLKYDFALCHIGMRKLKF